MRFAFGYRCVRESNPHHACRIVELSSPGLTIPRHAQPGRAADSVFTSSFALCAPCQASPGHARPRLTMTQFVHTGISSAPAAATPETPVMAPQIVVHIVSGPPIASVSGIPYRFLAS
jgi:hypothetical protein